METKKLRFVETITSKKTAETQKSNNATEKVSTKYEIQKKPMEMSKKRELNERTISKKPVETSKKIVKRLLPIKQRNRKSQIQHSSKRKMQ